MDEKTIRILVVEDDPAHAELVRIAFQSQAELVELTVASTLREARTQLEASTPDLVIADWGLPDGTGIELLPTDKENSVYPVLILTGQGDEQMAVEAMKAGAIDYVVKSEATLHDLAHIAKGVLREWNSMLARKDAEKLLRLSEHPTLDETTLDEIPKSGHPSIILHEGSEPKLATETQKLLRSRLRVSALLLSLGFFLFLVRNSILCDYSDRMAVSLLAFHGLVTFMLGLAGGLLSWNHDLSIRKLRVVELIIFGVPVWYFLTMQSIGLLEVREGLGSLGNSYSGAFQGEILPVWYILMLTYAFFIPSSVRRTAIATGTMAILPVIVLVVLRDQFASVARGLRFEYMTGQALLLAITAIACVVGSRLIHALRNEAFEAKQLGQYRLKHLIGAGGMGKVYLAEHQMMKRPCAIKLIHPEKAGDAKTLARFEREVQSIAKLSHTNTIEIFDYGHTRDGTFYYVMEYLPGMSLYELVEGCGPLPAERVIHFLVQTCNALREAHEMGLIHRDIKPGNIFSAYRGGTYDVVKLLDFGLVKPVVETKAARLTMEGTITGSPDYMAPEQIMSESEPDARSDIYSLGAVAYYLLTGHSPFENDNPMKAMFAHVHEKVIPPSQIRSSIPKDLEAIILRCLEKAPADRFSSAEALAMALSECDKAGCWTRENAFRWWTEHRTRFESSKVEPETMTQRTLEYQSDF